MIIGYDIRRFCEDNLEKSSFNRLSEDKITKEPLVENMSTAYDYESYVLNKLFKENPLKVVDAIFIKNNDIYLFEFKRGFEQIINIGNFDINYWKCPNKEISRKDGTDEPILCKDGAKYFLDNQKLKINELKLSLHGKLVETHTVLNRFIVPKCHHSETEYKIWFVAVVDNLVMPLEETQDILELMAGSQPTNKVADLRSSFTKYKRNGEDTLPLYYDEIEIWSVAEFEEKIKKLHNWKQIKGEIA